MHKTELIENLTRKYMGEMEIDKIKIRSISSCVGIRHQSLLYYYGNKENLIVETYKGMLNEVTVNDNPTFSDLLFSLFEYWSTKIDIVYNFNLSFKKNDRIKERIFTEFNIWSDFHLIRCSDVESANLDYYRMLLISLTFHPFISISNGEVNLDVEEILDFYASIKLSTNHSGIDK